MNKQRKPSSPTQPRPCSTRRSSLVGLLLLLAVQPGCARAIIAVPPPVPEVSETQRAALGTIGVAFVAIAPKDAFRPPTPGKGIGAAKAASLAASLPLEVGLQADYTESIALGIALAPVFAVGGAIYGAIAAEPAAAVAQAESALRRALAEGDFQRTLRDRVFLAIQAETGRPVVRLASDPPDGWRASPLAARGVDTVLEVCLNRVRLVGTGITPPLALTVEMTTRLVRAADRENLYESTLQYRSPTRTFVAWGAHDAQPFREELERGVQSLAERIVEDVFLLHVLPAARRAP